MTPQEVIKRLRDKAGWWSSDPNAVKVLEEFRDAVLSEERAAHVKTANRLLTCQRALEDAQRQLNIICSDETFPRTSLFDEMTMKQLRAEVDKNHARLNWLFMNAWATECLQEWRAQGNPIMPLLDQAIARSLIAPSERP